MHDILFTFEMVRILLSQQDLHFGIILEQNEPLTRIDVIDPMAY